MKKSILQLTLPSKSVKQVLETLSSLQKDQVISYSEPFIISKDESGDLHLYDSEGNSLDAAIYGRQTGGIIGSSNPAPFLLSSELGALLGVEGDMSDPDIIKGILQAVGDKLEPSQSSILTEVEEKEESSLESGLGSDVQITRKSL